MIVSVRELSPAVDLSSLEGHGGTPEEEEPDPARLKKAGTNLVHRSFFFPTDPEQPDWKPFSLKSYYIAMLTVVSLVLAGVQEYLYQRSHRLEKEGRGLVNFNDVDEISTLLFFCWKYLPTMVMVAYGVLWQITDFEVKRLEPYYQLSQPTGSTAAQSLNLDYATLWSYTVPIKAFKYKHWAVFVSSVASILATTAAPSLQSPSIDSVENPKCNDDPGTNCPDDFRYFIRIKAVWSRLVTVCLILVALFSIVLLIQLRRKSGLLSDPHGVAGIAAMATKSHILRDFDGMDEALHDDIHEKLRHRRYILYKSTIWQGEYTKNETSIRTDKPLKPPNPNPILLRPPFLMAFMISMAVFLPFIPAIAFTNLNIIARKLPWLPILLATSIKQLWTTLEFDVKLLHPFRTLATGPAPASQTLTLDYRGTPYGLLPAQALLNGHSLVALVGTGSILADILTITLASLALKAGTESPRSFIASSVLSIVIVAVLIAVAFLVFLRHRTPFMPRQPATIASILAFVHHSRMLDDFVGTERYSNARMQELLAAKNKRYALGWFKGRDSRPHCAIDEEPMLSRYVHGVSYLQAQAPWEENVGF
ncbi:DUF3433 domain-containing protein [Aspergillus clavatus NRRL 1]|uniref:Uncharacterized protein n=1 Tax=Aspergillus clavatus (strain ATCC 1007 / CBS 513.65 / DSM 816 / NCTC 3887 / NRRL 1 / QM 1276 / 107) TaxID=344612 RepID=A1CL44_ASPCL|nr:uncharacterized protein ACLA_040840 [Aspergillus clavatus NRRL 1]EAW09868.1 hypothetical protein ACLA_040840 [Aspergillus clavatus NRRL 1]